MELLPFTLFGSSSCLKVDGEGFIKDNPLDLSLEYAQEFTNKGE